MDEKPSGPESKESGSFIALLAVAGVLEIALLVLAVVFLGFAYSLGLHMAILVVVLVLTILAFWRWAFGAK